MNAPFDTAVAQPKNSPYRHVEPGTNFGPGGTAVPCPSAPTFTDEVCDKLGTLGMLLSDIQASSGRVRDRLLGPWPTPPQSKGDQNPAAGEPHPGAVIHAVLDILIERAATCRDNTNALDSRV